MSQAAPAKRPIGVTILAAGAALLGILSVYHLLQALGILQYVLGPVSVRGFNLYYVIVWALMAWVYFWLYKMLWRLDPSAWMFLAVITVFNLVVDFAILLGSETWSDVSVSFILNALILAYAMLPSVKNAFGTDSIPS